MSPFLLLIIAMAGIVRNTIDTEWANGLIGLRMLVPEYWWPAFTESTLCPATIVGIESNKYDAPVFQFQTDDEPGANYLMDYHHVRDYADEEQRDFDKYRLPSTPIRCPLHEVVEVRRRPRGRHLLISRAPSSEDDTSSSEEEEDDEPATKAYRLTNAEDWHRIINDDDIRVVEPIPFTGGVLLRMCLVVAVRDVLTPRDLLLVPLNQHQR